MGEFVEGSARDLRHAWHLMRKSPGFTAVAVLTLAIGIGGNTTMFSAVRAVLLKPLPYRDPAAVVRLTVAFPGRPGATSFTPIRLEEMRAAPALAEVGSYLIAPLNVTLSGGTGPEALKAARVSANFLHILGVEPVLGRGFAPTEDRPGAPAVVLISWELWQRRFSADPAITGKTVSIDSTPVTIVGVLPAGFQFPSNGLDVWFAQPFSVPGAPPQAWPGIPAQIGFARLRPSASLAQVRSELNGLGRQYVQTHPELTDADPRSTVQVERMQDSLVADVRTTLWLLLGAVGLVLLIACANVASLLLARGASRAREFAVRMAVGAARRRIVRQLLAESLLLAAAGGVLGMLLAYWALHSLLRLEWLNLPRQADIRLDTVVLGFTTAVSIAASLLFGLVPSWRMSRPDLAGLLRTQGAGASSVGGRRGSMLVSTRGLLVVAQIALSIVLLIGASLLIESLVRLHNVDPGFQPAGLLRMHISLPRARYDAGKQRAFWEELVRRVAALPGVRSATATQTLPMTIHYETPFAIAERPPVKIGDRPLSQFVSVTPGYFRTLGISLRRGREFNPQDAPGGLPRAAIVDESMIHRFWPDYPGGPNPIGAHILLGITQAGGIEIVGIVGNVHEFGLAAAAQPEIYLPMAYVPVPDADLAVRTTGDPLRLTAAIRRQVLQIDPDQPVSAVSTMQDIVDRSIGSRKLTMVLLSGFAGVAWLLAVVGLYGVIAYTITQRIPELSIRRALGARDADIFRLVIGQGLGLTLAGVVLGIGGALALTRFARSLLFATSATDPWTFAGIAVLFIVLASLASALPARRAARIDPMASLRTG
jgi:putative ABC transport system permease protein